MTEEKKLTGYPSIDKPWLKYYSADELNITVPECSIYENLLSHSEKRQKQTAIEYMGIKVSYKELFKRIEETAHALKAIGVNEGDIVSVCLPNIPEVVYLFYALNRLGAVANMLDPRCGETALKTALIEGQTKVLFTLDSVAGKFKCFLKETSVLTAVTVSAIQSFSAPLQSIIALKDKSLKVKCPAGFRTWNSFMKEARNHRDSIQTIYEEDADAVIAYTGGTTGQPKGVIATNKNLNSVVEMELRVGFNESVGDRLLDIAPPWTYYGICNSLHVPLCMGLCVVLLPKLGADELGMVITKIKPNHVITVPSSLDSLISDKRLEKRDFRFLKSVIVGADKCDESLERRVNAFLSSHGCGAVVTKGYGMTEVMAAAAYTKRECNGIGSVGIPYPGNTISAFSECNGVIRECKVTERGEIAIQGPSVMKAYFGSASEETCSIKRRHEDGSIWVHTGDIGYIGEDGRIYIEGRMKRMFVRNGYKVFPGSVEHCIMKHPEVANTGVVPVQDSVMGNLTTAFVVLKNANSDKERVQETLISVLSKELYDYELPDVYIFIEDLPLTGMGKIDYRALEEMAKGK